MIIDAHVHNIRLMQEYVLFWCYYVSALLIEQIFKRKLLYDVMSVFLSAFLP